MIYMKRLRYKVLNEDLPAVYIDRINFKKIEKDPMMQRLYYLLRSSNSKIDYDMSPKGKNNLYI